MFHFRVTAEALPLLLQKNSIDATIWSETWSHIYDAIRCELSDVSGYLIRTSGYLIWHDLTSLIILHMLGRCYMFLSKFYAIVGSTIFSV